MYKLNAMKLVTQAEIDVNNKRKAEIEASERRIYTMQVTGLASLAALQFGVSYYAIFCVPWLGWDLVEPLTYSVTQGSMLAGLYLTLRNRGWSTEFGENYDYMCKVK